MKRTRDNVSASRSFTRWLQVAVCLLTLAGGTNVIVAAEGQRDVISATQSTDSEDVERLDVTVKGAYIYITTTRPLTLRLYSILGQLIVQQEIQPGSTRIKAPAKGVYILKAASMTRRVTIN